MRYQYLNNHNFVFKEKEQVKVVREDDDGKEDVINCGHPVDLITALLKKLGGSATVNQLCQVTASAVFVCHRTSCIKHIS